MVRDKMGWFRITWGRVGVVDSSRSLSLSLSLSPSRVGAQDQEVDGNGLWLGFGGSREPGVVGIWAPYGTYGDKVMRRPK